jgi:uncharacterized delta-60 repeat protein
VVTVAAAATAWAGTSLGEIDLSFGESGKVITQFEPQEARDVATGIVALTSGKLIVAGSSEPPGADSDFALAAYEPHGALDEADFGSAGLRTTDFNGGRDEANAIALTPGGKLVVAGLAEQSATNDKLNFALARYALDGKLDRSFGGDGRVTTRMTRTSDDRALDLIVSPHGKITAAGESAPAAGGDKIALVRYRRDGRLDPSFGGDGRVLTRFPEGAGQDVAFSIAAAGHGKIVVAGGSVQAGNGPDFAVARYRADGSLDGSFGGDGHVTTDFGNGGFAEYAESVAIQPDGKILAGGLAQTTVGGQTVFAFARYRQGGALDQGFSTDGIAGIETETFTPGFDEGVVALALQDNGKILAAGSSNGDFALFRLLGAGGLDTQFSPFGTPGVETTDFGGTSATAKAMAVQPGDGNPVLAGFTNNSQVGTGLDFALARYHGGP